MHKETTRDQWRTVLERRLLAKEQRLALDDDARALFEAAERERCRRSFGFWLRHHGWMYGPKETARPARRLVPFVPWPSQVELAAWIEERREVGGRALIHKSREIGASWLILHYVLWAWIFEPGFSALLGSRKQETVDRKGDMTALFPKLRWLLARQPDHLRPDDFDDKLLVMRNGQNGSEITGESCNPEFGAAGRKSLVVIDEAARVPSRILRSIWTSTESVGGLMLLIFNAAARKDHFANELLSRMDPERVRELWWTADPSRSEEWKRSKIGGAGGLTAEEFQEAYECKSGATATGNAFRLRRSVVVYHEESDDFDASTRKTEPIFWAFDFGTGPKSLACIGAMIEWAAHPTIRIEEALGWNARTDFAQVAIPDLLQARGRFGNPSWVTGDPAGGQTQRDGKSYVADLKEAGLPWVPLQGVVEPESGDPLLVNSTAWKRWAIKTAQRWMDDGHLKIHERTEDVLLWAMERWRWNVPEGADVEDIRGHGELMKDLPSHACEAFLYVFAFCLAQIVAKRAAATSRSFDPDDDEAVLMDRGSW